MRFALIEGRLIPKLFLENPVETKNISSFDIPLQPPLKLDFQFDKDLQLLLTGKQLLIDDIPFDLQLLQSHYEAGYLVFRKGIELTKTGRQCLRCGNKESSMFATFPCSRCGERCTYCRKCIMMGRVSTCTPLISWTGPSPMLDTANLVWSGSLSEGQKVASSRVDEAVRQNKELLVWAVCGAGKTEVLFEGIESALATGKRVCIATPRTDVVLELTPRLQSVFPDIEVASLYGGSPDRHKHSPLTISTTHQLLRFYKAFDTIILDEVDAFPYSVDETLQYAVNQARKDISSMIYLTATPNHKWQKECRTGKREFVTIPARFHRHPLPVPKFQWCGNWEKLLKKNKFPPVVLKWVSARLEQNKQALLFIPKIEHLPKILAILKQIHPNIESVHAEDPNRKEKVQSMRNKETLLLLTTTILERGVTFPNLDVAVLGSEDRIFTESALVQIAGRVGRSPQYPTGNITFFHYGKTEAMVKARRQIMNMNKEAMQKGLIDL